MQISILKETAAGEKRVAATPTTVAELTKLGHTLVVEAGAGEGADLSDQAFREAGAEVASNAAEACRGADVVLKVLPPTEAEVDMLPEGVVL
ncbi:MAG: NAD(P)(+) transhydrogenase (Re/Si-specific) subunit alpha, partial [Planctomycetota bacterium]